MKQKKAFRDMKAIKADPRGFGSGSLEQEAIKKKLKHSSAQKPATLLAKTARTPWVLWLVCSPHSNQESNLLAPETGEQRRMAN